MKTIFLIGPSGVGKTTLIKELLKRIDNVVAVELDAEIKKEYPLIYSRAHLNWEKFWNVSLLCIKNQQMQVGDQFLIIDVGAGSLQSKKAQHFFRNENTVNVYDSPENTLKKVQSRVGSAWAGQSLVNFKAVEYSLIRQAIYNACHHRIDLSVCSTEEAVTELLFIVKDLNDKNEG